MQVYMIIGWVLLVASCILVLCAFFNNYLPKYFCDKFGWHVKPKVTTFDGSSLSGKCSRCGEDVMQDSQGNWF